MMTQQIADLQQLCEAISPHAGGISLAFSEYVWSVTDAVGSTMIAANEVIDEERVHDFVINPDPLVRKYARILVQEACDSGKVRLHSDWPARIQMMTRRPMPGGKRDPWMHLRDTETCWLVLLAQGELHYIFPGAGRDLVRRSPGSALFSYYTTGGGWSRLPALQAPGFVQESVRQWVQANAARSRLGELA